MGTNGSDYFDIDAKTFAEWGVDSFKFDGCGQDPKTFDVLYPKMGKALNATGRHMVYICEWPLYQLLKNITPNYTAIANACHVYRNHLDVRDSWASVSSIIDFYGQNNAEFSKYHGPGHYLDPDMIVVGDFGLTYEQSRTQMAMWAMFSAPLYMSNDLRTIRPEMKQIVQNKHIIAVNQDKHALMAKRLFADINHQVWAKQVEPMVKDQWSYAIVYMDNSHRRDRYYISHKLSDLIPGAKDLSNYKVEDLFGDELPADMKGPTLTLLVTTGNGSRMVKLTPK